MAAEPIVTDDNAAYTVKHRSHAYHVLDATGATVGEPFAYDADDFHGSQRPAYRAALAEAERRNEQYAASLRQRGPITHTVSDPLTVQLAQNRLRAERHAFLYAAQTGSEAAWLAMAESGAEMLKLRGL